MRLVETSANPPADNVVAAAGRFSGAARGAGKKRVATTGGC